jgi:hypothetical protein
VRQRSSDNPKAVVLDLMQPSESVLVARHGAMNPAGKVRCNMWAR